ncbi:hypothetical protein ABZ362_04345 [Streptomyces sp. NPDC005951]|uniref:hypothetical protein n=1 Tax=Streptomyces sp. NPDC005951 TaxID=3154573 RepID=UPI0033C0C5DE
MHLDGLSAAWFHPQTDKAQRFLASAYDSVDAVLDNLAIVRLARRAEGGDLRGRLTSNEEDLLRAALTFAGTGIDSALKQLIRDTLAVLLPVNKESASKFQIHAEARLAHEQASKLLAKYLTSGDPRGALIDDYVYELTGSSLQSTEQVQKVAGALGVTDANLRKRIGELKPLFVARNEIVHELDLKAPEKSGDRHRRMRSIGKTKDMAHHGLETAQQIINSVAKALGSPGPHGKPEA